MAVGAGSSANWGPGGKKKGEFHNQLLRNGCRFITYTKYYYTLYAVSFMYLLIIHASNIRIITYQLGTVRRQTS